MPSLRLTYPSFTVESHPLGPLALNFMPVWAALALLSPFTLPWELSSGACSASSSENSFIGLESKLLSESTGSRMEAFSWESAILPDFLGKREMSGSEQKPQE